MADRLDVPGRLAEGAPAVDHTQRYVWAVGLLGYQNAELTAHSRQLWDTYGTEDGLDLAALDADCVLLDNAALAAVDSAAAQRDVVDALSAAWSGDGARGAVDFVRKHCDAADLLAAALSTAATTLATLRDSLWVAVDTKVGAVIAIDDRHAVERPTWLAAADTVCTGVGDRASAAETVDLYVKPYVDNDIRVDWLAAMHAANDAVATAYATAIDQLSASAVPTFEIPGDLGPPVRHATTPAAAPPTVSPSATQSVPSTVAAPAAETVPATETVPTQSMPMQTTPTAQVTPTSQPLTSASDALPGVTQSDSGTTGFSDLLSGFADSISGLLGSIGATDGMPAGVGSDLASDSALGATDAVEPPELDAEPALEGELADDNTDPDVDEDDIDSETTEPEPGVDEEAEDPEVGADTGVESPVETPDEPVVDEPLPAPPIVTPEPTPTPAPTPTPTAEPLGTPCEIPADELPQVGPGEDR